MLNLKLTDEQLTAGASVLVNNKLTNSQVEDLTSIFRGFLSELANDYSIKPTLEGLEDSTEIKTCAKLSACLLMFQDIGFDNGGFAPTNANRTGFNTSVDMEEYKTFRYAFGLLWSIPKQLDNQFLGGVSRRRTTVQGKFRLVLR